MIRSARPSALALATTVVVALVASGCSGHKKASPSSTPATSAPASSSSAAPSSTPAPPATHAKNPYTGVGAVPTTPTIAVKIDDTPPGRPQVGIDKADIIYIEEAEGGLTRLVAIFGTSKPYHVGYVRSTRPSDPDLLLQYGKITEAASGGGHDALPLLDRSGVKGWINDRHAPYYSRVSRAASDYINLELDVHAVATKVRTAKPKDIGLRFSARPSGKGGRGTDVRTRVGSQLVEFRWAAKLKQYVRYIDGVEQRAADGRPMATPNVVVQTCKIVPHPQDTDVNGNPSQFTMTVGKGAVSVFRNGQRFDGTWSRKNLGSGTTLTTRSGKTLALAPGGAWFALVRASARTTG